MEESRVHSELSKSIGKAIRIFRETKCLSQSHLSRELAISAQFLGKIEKGEVPVPDWIVVHLLALRGFNNSTLRRAFYESGRQKYLNLLRQANKQK